MGPNLGVTFQSGGRLAVRRLDLDRVQDMRPGGGGGSVTDDGCCRDRHGKYGVGSGGRGELEVQSTSI